MLDLQLSSQEIYANKYQLKNVDRDIFDTYSRVAKSLAEFELEDKRHYWEQRFYWAMENGATPGGRILSNAGAETYKPNASLINCVVSGTIEDSIEGIMNAAKEAAITLSKGSGLGYCFSSIRPRNSYINGVGAYTSGSLSFMEIFNTMCFTINSAGGRRGAQMGTHFCWHPDIEEFITCKQQNGMLRQFNLSVLITDDFLDAVKNDSNWELYFPIHKEEYRSLMNSTDSKDMETAKNITYRPFPFEDDNYIVHDYDKNVKMCKIYKVIKARYLWNLITKSTYEFSEPGILFYDKINSENNNYFCENLVATNPCVTGDTLIITKSGSCRIDSVIDKTIEIWNGYEWSMVTPKKTSESESDLKTITFSNGSKLTCTSYHKFILQNNLRIEAKLLSVGDIIQLFYYPDGEPQRHIRITKIKDEKINVPVYCFTDKKNNSGVFNGILTGNCGEQPLPEHGSCLLGSINLTKFVEQPFSNNASFDFTTFSKVVAVFARMLDNVVEKNGLALTQQQNEILTKRRHGMGFYGLGSALVMMKKKYGSESSIAFTKKISEIMATVNYEVGYKLAQEKGMAPILDEMFPVTNKIEDRLQSLPRSVHYQISAYMKNKPTEISGKILWCISNYMLRLRDLYPALWENLLEYGCRYTHATTVPPTGTTSLSIGNNASNGIEPSFSHAYIRNIVTPGKKSKGQTDIYSYEYLLYKKLNPDLNLDVNNLPDYFVTADSITTEQHILIQSAAQLWCDSSISKTINIKTDMPFEEFQNVYDLAHKHNLKGCATFRFNPKVFSGVLINEKDLKNTKYKFVLEDGKVVTVDGNETIMYDGEVHVASNLFDALKEGYYGKF